MLFDSRRGGSLRVIALVIAPALPVIFMAALLVRHTQDWTTQRATSNAAASASFIADFSISPLLEESDFTSSVVDPRRTAELDVTFQPIIGDSIVRIKVWDANGRVVYSDDPNNVGRTYPISHELADALAGDTSSEVSELDGTENFGEQKHNRLLEVYVPVSVGQEAQIDGAFELYLPYDPIAVSIQTDTRRILTMLGVTLVLLYLALAYVAVLWSRTHRRADESEHDANHDHLTGLANRRRFGMMLDSLAVEQPKGQVAVLFIDLDDFKHVNDQHGHAVGDALLTAVADRLTHAVPSDALLARLGGDEFAVLVPRLEALSDAVDVADSLIECLAAPVEIDDLRVQVQASIGIDVTTADRVDPDLMQRNADAAMYAAKIAGKGRHALFVADLPRMQERESDLLSTQVG